MYGSNRIYGGNFARFLLNGFAIHYAITLPQEWTREADFVAKHCCCSTGITSAWVLTVDVSEQHEGDREDFYYCYMAKCECEVFMSSNKTGIIENQTK